MRKQPSIQIHGERNVVADAVHLYLLPPITQVGSVTRKRAWIATALSFIGGMTVGFCHSALLKQGCIALVTLVTLMVLLRGGPHGTERPEEPPHG